MKTALIIGAGPAGLMAAEPLLAAGARVILAEAKPSPARKFLMAGKSGLNLTKAEDFADFLPNYCARSAVLEPFLSAFGPQDVMRWAEELGAPLFTGSSGRVFPVAMKASPLLRAWLTRLGAAGLDLRTRWRWTGWQGTAFTFDTPTGPQSLTPDVTVLATGGASWARLGSDGSFKPLLEARGVEIAPFRPANMGFRVDWSPQMARHFGQPVKGTTLIAGGQNVQAEFVLSARGLEGGGIYAVSAALRDGAPLTLDLMPDWSAARIAERLAKANRKDSAANRLRKALRLDPVKIALLQEFGRPLPDGAALAALIKALPVSHAGPRPLDEAISVAGGVPFDALDAGLMLKALPGVFCAGEMLDWEAPTGGYLLTACFATGLRAGESAAKWLD
ncbi:TIGR03862 family flavoprotein [Pseudoruegeria sp. SHC-113]|uniref:TIGR03862 family flavoprotein n=1 Tax=Pseudoruegeria sp. SHC-113 TaxID=2855439 RepID=UPI0021BAAC51|nr:TIGR03862 family flavoprotein [Pseudoruegeria sp. SHC-113]MCT8158482.1 TIGR03862 family flavoprotein [Pseudoruegeria sp. SHC-113]